MAHVFRLCFSLLGTFATVVAVNLDGWQRSQFVKLRIVIPPSGSIEGLEATFASLPEGLQSLVLGLEGTSADDSMARALSRDLQKTVKELQSLDLNFKDTLVTNAGIKTLASSLPEKLKTLSLSVTMNATTVNDTGLKDVVDSLPPSLDSLFVEVAGSEAQDTLEILHSVMGFLVEQDDRWEGTATWNSPHGYLRAERVVNQVWCSSVDVVASVVVACNASHLDVELNNETGSYRVVAEHLPRTARALRIVIPPSGYVEGLEAHVKDLPRRLRSLGLGLEGTSVDDSMARALARDLQKTVKDLQSLDLNFKDTLVTNAGIKRLASSLPEKLKTLSLSVTVDATKVTVTGLKDIVDALPQRIESLFVEVARNESQDTLGILQTVKGFLEEKDDRWDGKITVSSRDSYLRAERAVNQVGCGSVDDVAWVVVACNASHLDVELNNETGSLSVVAEHLPRTARALRIAIPPSGSVQGLEAFVAVLPEGLQSLVLGLEGTSIDDGMARALATDLQKTVKDLQSLDLNFKDTLVTNAGIKTLASSLPEKLKTLSLNVNMNVTTVTVTGVKDVLDSLPPSLESLFVEVADYKPHGALLVLHAMWFFLCQQDDPWTGRVIWNSRTSYLRARRPPPSP